MLRVAVSRLWLSSTQYSSSTVNLPAAVAAAPAFGEAGSPVFCTFVQVVGVRWQFLTVTVCSVTGFIALQLAAERGIVHAQQLSMAMAYSMGVIVAHDW